MIGYTGHEIPAAPVLVAVVFAGAVLVLRRLRGRLTPLRLVVGLTTVVYAAGVIGHVLLPYPIGARFPGEEIPWHVWIEPVPFADADPAGIILNTALFVPLGVLLPLLVAGTTWRRVLVTGFCLSLTIELVQLIGDLTVSSGRVADVDDLIGNTVGAVLGYGVLRAVTAVPLLRRVADRATWPLLDDRARSARR